MTNVIDNIDMWQANGVERTGDLPLRLSSAGENFATGYPVEE